MKKKVVLNKEFRCCRWVVEFIFDTSYISVGLFSYWQRKNKNFNFMFYILPFKFHLKVEW